MRARLAFAVVAFLACLAPLTATAQILPPPPAIPAPPAQLQPLLELLSGPGGTLTEPGCASLGTVLGLGVVVIPGLPGTFEQVTGISLSGLPVAAQPELLSLVSTLLFVQGAGCGLLPLAAERTVCASDDEIAAQLAQVRTQLNLPGLPVQLGDFFPVPAPTAGTIVDTFRSLAAFGVPGAAEVAAAMNNVGDCELRTRFTNVEPPPGPADPTPAPIVAPARVAVAAPDESPLASPPAFNPVPAITRTPISAGETSVVPASISDTVPRWLQLLAVGALIAFLYRAAAPRRVS